MRKPDCADYVFDGLIFDWVVQSKISKSLESAVKAQRKVHKILQWLALRSEALEDHARKLEAERLACSEDA